uniref:Ufm1-specific protease 2 n=1 Tax=Rhabditophanes sp. KR3021 TaxID=114890 RepID=A0AC35UGN6_9BILA
MIQKLHCDYSKVFQNIDSANSDFVLCYGLKDRQLVTNAIFATKSGIVKQLEFLNTTFTSDISLIAIGSLKDNIRCDVQLLKDLNISKESVFIIPDCSLYNIKNNTFLNIEDTKITSVYEDKKTCGIHLKYGMNLESTVNDLDKEIKRIQENLDKLVFVNINSELLIDKDSCGNSLSTYVSQNGLGNIKNNSVVFECHLNLQSTNSDEVPYVPLIKEEVNTFNISKLATTVSIFVPFNTTDTDSIAYTHFVEAIKRILTQAAYIFQKNNSFSKLKCMTFVLPSTQVYVNILVCENEREEKQIEWRKFLHNMFNLPLSAPVFRSSQSLGSVIKFANVLLNPHETLTYVPKGESAIISGKYGYHHYMQDNFNDAGWGCAYRSFQTIWSWLLYQGYTDKAVPTHKEMQKCLFEIGDKDAKFVGSSQWIGSTEISYCIDSMLGIQSKILSISSGSEMYEVARPLIHHFKSGGAPVMIGGNQLAHTILGINYDITSGNGDCQLLVLDPHYTGEEDIKKIISKGWCGWKPMTFWNKNCFYNLLLCCPSDEEINI